MVSFNPYTAGAAFLLVVAVGAAGVTVVHTYNTALEERDEAYDTIAEQSKQLEQQAVNMAVLEARNQALLSAQKSRQDVEVGIQKAFAQRDAQTRSYQNAPDTRDWFNTELPQRLRIIPEEAGASNVSNADGLRTPALPAANPKAGYTAPR